MNNVEETIRGTELEDRSGNISIDNFFTIGRDNIDNRQTDHILDALTLAGRTMAERENDFYEAERDRMVQRAEENIMYPNANSSVNLGQSICNRCEHECFEQGKTECAFYEERVGMSSTIEFTDGMNLYPFNYPYIIIPSNVDIRAINSSDSFQSITVETTNDPQRIYNYFDEQRIWVEEPIGSENIINAIAELRGRHYQVNALLVHPDNLEQFVNILNDEYGWDMIINDNDSLRVYGLDVIPTRWVDGDVLSVMVASRSYIHEYEQYLYRLHLARLGLPEVTISRDEATSVYCISYSNDRTTSTLTVTDEYLESYITRNDVVTLEVALLNIFLDYLVYNSAGDRVFRRANILPRGVSFEYITVPRGS